MSLQNLRILCRKPGEKAGFIGHLRIPRSASPLGRDNRKVLPDLPESAALVQDADIVGRLHRPSFYARESEPDPTPAELIIAKHCNGPTGIVELESGSRWHGLRRSEPTNPQLLRPALERREVLHDLQ